MKALLKIVGGVLVLIGIVWILQGFNILPGSFMTGDKFWAGMGAIAVVVGLLLLGVLDVLRGTKPKP
jgi:hypothetical protein